MPLNRTFHGWSEPNFKRWSDLTHLTSVASSNFSTAELLPNVVYRCLVVAVNSAGLVSDVIASDGFTFDATHSTNGTVAESPHTWTADHSSGTLTAATGWGSRSHEMVDADISPVDSQALHIAYLLLATFYFLLPTSYSPVDSQALHIAYLLLTTTSYLLLAC